VNDATASSPSAALQIENSSCAILLKMNGTRHSGKGMTGKANCKKKQISDLYPWEQRFSRFIGARGHIRAIMLAKHNAREYTERSSRDRVRIKTDTGLQCSVLCYGLFPGRFTPRAGFVRSAAITDAVFLTKTGYASGGGT
ncbi:MAG TPA: hypothetical protein DF613_14245, partial [Lachnospiraceae bacterium]|nr:hypothetical protein [Lachnospiraceae bacterium]